MTLDDTLAVLHPVQRAAVTHPARPLLLACGPGSGKTRILTHRIQWLIQREGLEATEILALTFSRAAADELRGRLARALGPLAKCLWTGTFHGFGAWLLRRHAAPLGRTAAFTILDRDDTRRVSTATSPRASRRWSRRRLRRCRRPAIRPCRVPDRSRRSWPPTRRGAGRRMRSTSRTCWPRR
ncbi:MAG: hypothetical protein DMD79_25710 [Candidatus Rokuibacteriota bacterium]|nr:MAG: hypothetical protein DMD79_25710 [Candidatus Rokubacteria bacterium]